MTYELIILLCQLFLRVIFLLITLLTYLSIHNEIRLMIWKIGLMIHNLYLDLITGLKKYNHTLFPCYLGREAFYVRLGGIILITLVVIVKVC